MMKSLGATAALLAALTTATPAAAADCWSGEQAAAARVRDLQSKLMVATMRCHAAGMEIADAYNGFIRSNRASLEGINVTIKARFAAAYGTSGQFHYDKFTTSLANAYGADSTRAEDCAAAADAAREAAAGAGGVAQLLGVAERMRVAPRLPGGLCPVILAQSAAPVVAAPVVLAVASVAASADLPSVLASAALPLPAAPFVDQPRVERPAITLAALRPTQAR